MLEQTTVAGQYRHFKNGKIYEVIDQARHTETMENLIVYRAFGEPQLWVRPADMFFEQVMHNGQQVPRFQQIS